MEKRLVGARGVDVNAAACGLAQEKSGKALPKQTCGRVRCPGEVAIKSIRTSLAPGGIAVLAIGAEIITEPKGMSAPDLGKCRLEEIDVESRVVAGRVTEGRKLIYVESRQILGAGKEGDDRGGPAQRRGIEVAVTGPLILLRKAAGTQAEVEHHGG